MLIERRVCGASFSVVLPHFRRSCVERLREPPQDFYARPSGPTGKARIACLR